MARKPVKSAANDRSLVPILFTIGVIGWGFFAIDRLLSPEMKRIQNNGGPKIESAKDTENSWSSWLLDYIESKSSKNKKVNDTRNVPSRFEQSQPENNMPILGDDPITGFSMEAQQQLQKNVYIYLYALDREGNPVLKRLTRRVSSEDQMGSALQEVINGPTSAEEQKDFIDSFPAKPMILNVEKIRETLVLDLDDQFGVGVSFQSLRFQLQQLWKTASQFSGVKSLKIRINGREVKHLGGDGTPLPSLINDETFARS